MPEIKLKNVSKKFGNIYAVDHLSLTIQDGDFVSLLGPSGCGKTTTLRMIAGLETPTEGEIFIDGRCVFSSEKGIDVSPDKRGIGFLFQSYALWPHMTVRRNVGYGLENLKWDKKKIRERVDALLQLLRIEEYADRYPSELSGGQQQRVAIARTLSTSPSILLMDEPLSNLDAKLRMEMRAELKRLHKSTHSTFVYVTHDQSEAMTLSTDVCLMKEGVLQQFCNPLVLYERPANTFVADFVGTPSINLVPVSAAKQDEAIVLTHGCLHLTFTPQEPVQNLPDACIVGIRPECITVNHGGNIPMQIQASLPTGAETTVGIQAGDLNMQALVFEIVDYELDDQVMIGFNDRTCQLFDAETKERIALGWVRET